MVAHYFLELVPTAIVSASCNKPTIQDGTVTPDTGTVESGSTYQVSCNSGFTISGSPTITCTNGQLSTYPTCQPCKSELNFRFRYCATCPSILCKYGGRYSDSGQWTHQVSRRFLGLMVINWRRRPKFLTSVSLQHPVANQQYKMVLLHQIQGL